MAMADLAMIGKCSKNSFPGNRAKSRYPFTRELLSTSQGTKLVFCMSKTSVVRSLHTLYDSLGVKYETKYILNKLRSGVHAVCWDVCFVDVYDKSIISY